MQSAKVGNALPDGATVDVDCESTGTYVSNGSENLNVWDRLTDGTWLPNAFLNTGASGFTPGVPRCADLDRLREAFSGSYNRVGAANDAIEFSQTANLLIADCTYFVSLSLWDGGGLPHTTEWTNDSPDRSLWASRFLAPGVTKAAAKASEFLRYMEESGTADVSRITWSDNTANGAMLGDVIAYDWDPAPGVDHVAIVTAFNDDGYPLVSQHTPNQTNRYWSWSETAGDWIEFANPGSVAYLIHIKV